AVVVGVGVVRLEPDRLVIVGDGAIEVAPPVPGNPTVDVAVRRFRIEPDGRVEIRNGAVELAPVPQDVAAVVVGDRLVFRGGPVGPDDRGTAADMVAERRALLVLAN